MPPSSQSITGQDPRRLLSDGKPMRALWALCAHTEPVSEREVWQWLRAKHEEHWMSGSTRRHAPWFPTDWNGALRTLIKHELATREPRGRGFVYQATDAGRFEWQRRQEATR